MARRKLHLHDGKAGAALTVRVTPRSSRNAITGIMEDGTVKIQLTAAPVDGEANRKLIELLAKTLDVPRSNIEIVAGEAGRDKLVSVLGIDAAALHARVLAAAR
jgi:uncharacterized protein (TIGR00251 family)